MPSRESKPPGNSNILPVEIVTKPRLMIVLGTRPEAVKLAPVVLAAENSGAFALEVCDTGQHREMTGQMLAFFGIHPDKDLGVMTPGQPLGELTAKIIATCSEAFREHHPDMVIVQGDTSSALGAALAASLQEIPVAHVEAGLRSHNRKAPFPEESNRVLISHLADLHFAPTELARINLQHEGITERVSVVGNTVVDALQLVLKHLAKSADGPVPAPFRDIRKDHQIILVTLHRRESLGEPLARVCSAILHLAEKHPEAEIVFPVHPNKNVRHVVLSLLSGRKNIHLLQPLLYTDFIWILSKTSLVITDSGGVVEESSTLGIPLLVARECTERSEAVTSGCAIMTGSDFERIETLAENILADSKNTPHHGSAVFGDGRASARIIARIQEYFNHHPPEA